MFLWHDIYVEIKQNNESHQKPIVVIMVRMVVTNLEWSGKHFAILHHFSKALNLRYLYYLWSANKSNSNILHGRKLQHVAEVKEYLQKKYIQWNCIWPVLFVAEGFNYNRSAQIFHFVGKNIMFSFSFDEVSHWTQPQWKSKTVCQLKVNKPALVSLLFV